jgi:hypothetical protein
MSKMGNQQIEYVNDSITFCLLNGIVLVRLTNIRMATIMYVINTKIIS